MSHPIVGRLHSDDPADRRAACREAAHDPAGALLVEGLVEALGDPVRAVVRAASDSLVILGQRGGVEPLLRRELRGNDPRRRFGIAYTLARLQPPDPGLLPPLVEALASPEGEVRWTATRLLVDMGRSHGEVLPLLLGLLRTDSRARVRRMAALAVRELGRDRPECAEGLLGATRDGDLEVRRSAFAALAGLLDPPAEVGARLLEALEVDRDGPIRCAAAVGLGELAASRSASLPPGAEAALRRVEARAPDRGLRRAARSALERLVGGSAEGERDPTSRGHG